MKYIDNFPYDVKIVEDWIPLADGTKLWMKAFMPVTDEKVPALLEYLPYRAGDWTAPRDHERHPYYAGHGYASIRVDIRGHGNSDGVPGDEYDEQELSDGEEVLAWIAEQEWCTGDVGMFGISWGGFNSLQLAARKPPQLKAIVTTCSTDDRYDNDVHYLGGSMLAVDMHAWAATMLAFESRPSDPRVVGDQWKDQWLDRLNKMEPYIDEWMRHQTRDEYWKHGSACEDYDNIDAAVFAVGGWFDPYRDTVLRLCENLTSRGKSVKGLIGPWSHQYPDRDLRPGPHIDFLGETLRFWDLHLKGKQTGFDEEPLLRAWMLDSMRPSSVYDEVGGTWVAEESWNTDERPRERFSFASANALPAAERSGSEIRVKSPQDTGMSAGRYFPFGNSGDLPTDQRVDDAKSVCFDFVLDTDVRILGNAALRLRVKSAHAKGQAYVRLTDVAPDGSSTLVTRGNMNFSAREGRDKAVEMPSDQWVDLDIPLTGIGYVLPKGHTLRVAISSAYWPWVWPQPGADGFSVDIDGSFLEVPVREKPVEGSEAASRDAAVGFAEAVQPTPLDVEYPEAGRAGSARPERLVQQDVVKRETMLQVDPAYGGTRVYPDGLHYDEDTVERYWIRWDDPLSARTEAVWNVGLRRPDLGWDVSLTATTRISCTAEAFTTESIVECRDGDETVFEKRWSEEIPRIAS